MYSIFNYQGNYLQKRSQFNLCINCPNKFICFSQAYYGNRFPEYNSVSSKISSKMSKNNNEEDNIIEQNKIQENLEENIDLLETEENSFLLQKQSEEDKIEVIQTNSNSQDISNSNAMVVKDNGETVPLVAKKTIFGIKYVEDKPKKK